MPPAARVGDMHTCPMVNPGPVPHVGGPILPPGCPTVLIGGLPAARVGDMAICVGPPDVDRHGLADGADRQHDGGPAGRPDGPRRRDRRRAARRCRSASPARAPSSRSRRSSAPRSASTDRADIRPPCEALVSDEPCEWSWRSSPNPGRIAPSRSRAVESPRSVGAAGRTCMCPGDAALSDLHFLVSCGSSQCSVRDLNTPGGTWLNGTKVKQATLRDGDRIVAGQTDLRHPHRGRQAPTIESGDPTLPGGDLPAEAASLNAQDADFLLHALRAEGPTLYSLLDAARSPEVLVTLHAHEERFQSLYEGVRGETLAEFAPYLVQLAPDSPLLELLVRDRWGQSWGVYVACDQPFDAAPEALSPLPHGAGGGWSSTVLPLLRSPRPAHLPGHLHARTRPAQFFGPIRCFLLEGEEPGTLSHFIPGGLAVQQTMIRPPAQADAGG